MKSTSTLTLQMITGILPLDMHVKYLALATYYRLKAYGFTKRYPDGIVLDRMLCKGSNLSSLPSDLVTKVSRPVARTDFMGHPNVDRPSFDIKVFTIFYHCDAGAAGCYLITGDQIDQQVFCQLFDLHITEIQGTSLMLRMALSELISNKHLSIGVYYSTPAIPSILSTNRIFSDYVYKCLSIFDKVALNNDVLVVPVQHNPDMVFLNICRGEAIATALTAATNCKPTMPVAYSQVKKELSHYFVELTNEEWNINQGNLNTKLFIDKYNPKVQKWLMSRSRKELKVLTEIISGHCKLNFHLYKIGKVNNPSCTFCNTEVESVTHYICVCSQYSGTRKDAFERNLLEPVSLKSIELSKLLKFILASGRFEI
jgi:hypothetical protein